MVLAVAIDFGQVERQLHFETADQVDSFFVEQSAEFVGGIAVFLIVNPVQDDHQSIADQLEITGLSGNHVENLLDVPGIVIAFFEEFHQTFPGVEGHALHQIIELLLLQVRAGHGHSFEQL